MRWIILVLFITAGLGISSCKQSAGTNNSEKMATELCACMQPLADINKKIIAASNSGNTEEVQKLFEEVEKLSTEAENCSEKLEVQYGELNETQEQEVEKAMIRICPEVTEIISKAKQMQEEF